MRMIRQLIFLKGPFRYRQFVESRGPFVISTTHIPSRRFFTAFVHLTRSTPATVFSHRLLVLRPVLLH